MPRGPLNVPRPIATSSVNIVFYTGQMSHSPSEVAIENGLRQDARNKGYDTMRNVDVVVNSAQKPGNFVITLVTRESIVPHDEIEDAWEYIEDHIGKQISSHNVEIRAT